MDDLINLVSLFISKVEATRSFMKYCEVHAGWLPYSKVNEADVRVCLDSFKKEHPEVALN